VNRQRIDAKSLLILGSALLTALLAACSTPAVGAPCLPEQVPATGFDDREAYIESSSVQCQTRVCMVYKLRGDPRTDCNPTPTTAACDPMKDPKCIPAVQCATKDQVADRVYCTCRCKAPANTAFANCTCPDGFSCVDVLDQGDPGVRGSYCVKNKTFNTM
jgi:hypothetical protein